MGIREWRLFKSYLRLLFYHFLVVSCKTVPQWRSKIRRKGRRLLHYHSLIPSELHSAACLYHRSRASSKARSPDSAVCCSSINLQHSLLSLRSSSSCLLLLPRLPLVPTYYCFNNVLERQFLLKMWPIQLSFVLYIVCRIFHSSLTYLLT